MNLVELFLKQVDARPDAAAIITPQGRVVSYRELARASAARAQIYQRSGVGAGDTVLIARGVSVELYETLKRERLKSSWFCCAGKQAGPVSARIARK